MTSGRWTSLVVLMAACRVTEVDVDLIERTISVAEKAMIDAGFSSSGPLVTFEVHAFEDQTLDGSCLGPFKDGHFEIRLSPKIESTMERIVFHELGHALGLKHSSDPANVMYEWVSMQVGPVEPDGLALQLKEGCDSEGCTSDGLTFGGVKE